MGDESQTSPLQLALNTIAPTVKDLLSSEKLGEAGKSLLNGFLDSKLEPNERLRKLGHISETTYMLGDIVKLMSIYQQTEAANYQTYCNACRDIAQMALETQKRLSSSVERDSEAVAKMIESFKQNAEFGNQAMKEAVQRIEKYNDALMARENYFDMVSCREKYRKADPRATEEQLDKWADQARADWTRSIDQKIQICQFSVTAINQIVTAHSATLGEALKFIERREKMFMEYRNVVQQITRDISYKAMDMMDKKEQKSGMTEFLQNLPGIIGALKGIATPSSAPAPAQIAPAQAVPAIQAAPVPVAAPSPKFCPECATPTNGGKFCANCAFKF